jgi:hypothetical protein
MGALWATQVSRVELPGGPSALAVKRPMPALTLKGGRIRGVCDGRYLMVAAAAPVEREEALTTAAAALLALMVAFVFYEEIVTTTGFVSTGLL